jgi:hypothetical protein
MIAACYALALRLYPADYRNRFGAEMTVAFLAAAEEHRAHGLRFARFAAAELANLLWTACAEWIGKATSDRSWRGRSMPDPRAMRPPGILRREWLRDL